MKQYIPVSEIMTKNIIGLTRSDDLQRAEKLFNRYQIKHMPVVSGETIIGMLSFSDLLKISCADVSEDQHNVDTVVYNMFTIEQVMTKNVVTISADASLKEAAKILADREFHALPVVNEDNSLVGIITSTDILYYLVKEL